ncbi:uncharacterized protein [Hyperolius riggenbachi]|uniref:uncharacterized protein n=1 Tax=Hyperolius riggenbachi TaxID=752182 RepID=UPI0035A26F26
MGTCGSDLDHGTLEKDISAVCATVQIWNVHFNSSDSHATLHWKTSCDIQPFCHYEVQYKIRGFNWTDKTECFGTQKSCNMTTELLQKQTLGKEVWARVRVRAGNVTSSWTRKRPFPAIGHSTSDVHTGVQIRNVYFDSVNFRTVLHWEAVCDKQPTCSYEVQYKIYGENWKNKIDCWRSENSCDVTTETLMERHVEEPMWGRVRVRQGNTTSTWKETKYFTPIQDTNITSPKVSLYPFWDSILVKITAPQLLYVTEHPEKAKECISFSITTSTLSKVLRTEDTEHNVWTVTNLTLGQYCISVEMKFNDITSDPSPKQCVILKDRTAEEVAVGSAFSVVMVGILAVCLITYRHVFHPKTVLPQILAFNGLHPKTIGSDNKSDDPFSAPFMFEGMQYPRYTLEADNKAQKHPENKRYVSTETCRKDYVNFIQNDVHVPLNKTLELRNSTYERNASECYITSEYPDVWISSDTRYTKDNPCLHYPLISNLSVYYNDLTACKKECNKTKQLYFNQERELHRFYVNDPKIIHNSISEKSYPRPV